MKSVNWNRILLAVGGVVILVALFLGPVADWHKRRQSLARAEAGKALWKEKCRTVAGEKIYRKVEDVEGVLLMKVRPTPSNFDLADPNWPGAAFARESRANEFIDTFLGYEHASNAAGRNDPITPINRGIVSTSNRPGGIPGYRWVEVVDEKDGQRYRYSGRYDEPWRTDSSYSKSYVRFNLDRTHSPSPTPPRYGVTYEDHVIPEERYLGIASSTITVLDLESKEVLGKMIRYAWSVPASSANPSPWLTAYRCPDHAVGTNSATRKFVDQILIPTKGE